MTNFSIVVSVLLLTLLIKEGACLLCYQCNSEQDEACRDLSGSPADKYLVDCTLQESVSYNHMYLRGILPSEIVSHVQGAPTFCYKIVLETGTVIRTCLDTNPVNINYTCSLLESYFTFQPSQNQLKIKLCSVCYKDSCNGA